MRKTNGLCIHKQILSVIMALAVLLLALPVWSLTAYSAENSGEVMPLALTAEDIIKGSGTEGDPYLIETAGQLKMLADDSSLWDKHFWLTADIDLGGEANGSWSPIGNSTTKFTGTFDGDGHKISGLFINNTTSDYQGLFGYISGGTIKNLGVNGNVTGGQHVGGVVGRAQSNTTVQNCYNTGSVTAKYFFGGVVGYSENSTVQNCYNTGNIRDNDGGDGNFGGIVGFILGGTVQNCYNTGNVSGGTDFGGVVGYNDSGNVQNCYFLQGSASSGIGSGTGTAAVLTQTQFAQQTAFSGWDFNDVWTMSALLDRPILTVNPEIPGDGGDGDPYRLSTAEHLKALAAKVNGGNSFSGTYFKLTRDIDLSSVCGENIGGSDVSWTPIGNNGSYPYKPFSGTFDGGGHLISGLYINTDENSSQGLFGHIENGTVKNLGVSGSVTSKPTNYPRYAGGIGGIVGYSSYNSNVQNCYNDSNVSGYYYVGGIVGQAENRTTVQNCYNTGDIREESGYEYSAYAGGIVGYNTSSNVQNCYNTGDISRGAEGNVGGIVGGEMSSSISNCYYLEGTAERGSGSWNDSFGYIEVKTEAEFKSGEVAWLLQHGKYKQNEQVWYQKVDAEDFPVFKPYDNISVVYRVAFISKVSKSGYQTVFGAFYGNSGFTVSAAPSGKPELNGYEFVRWTTDKAQTGENYEFKSVTVTDEDVEIYAVWREKFGANDSAEPLAIKLSQGETSDEYDLDELLAYYTGAAKAAGNFTYTSRYTDGLTVTINGSKLTVTAADDAAVGEHVLTVTASEKSPQLSTIALADFGTEDVELTVTVTVIGNRGALDEDDIEITKSDTTITVTSPDNTGGDFEYSKDGGITWQDSNEFSGLNPGETYEISVRYKETDEYNASDSATKEVTTLNEDGSTTLKSGETVKNTKKGEDVTNKGGKVTVTDDNGNETTVTLPDSITDVEIDENGNVIIPGGSTVTPENGPALTVEDDAIVSADGSVTFPDGGDVKIDDTVVTVPENETVKPNGDGTVTVPDGSAVTPPSGKPQIEITDADDEATVDKDGNVTFPDGGTAKVGDSTVDVPAGGTLEPVGDSLVKVPAGSTVNGDVLTDDGILDENGNLFEGAVRIGDVLFIPPEGETVTDNGDGTVTVPAGTVVVPDNGTDYTVESEGGKVDSTDGSVTLPKGGSIKLGNTIVTVPDGGKLTPNNDNTVTVPDGSVVAPNGGEPEISITNANNEATVNKNGNVTLPKGGDVRLGDTTVTVPDGGTVKPNDDGSVTLPEGGDVKIGDTTATVPAGGTIKPNDDGSVTLPEGGDVKIGDSTVEVPRGGTLTPNGEGGVILPGGSKVTDKDGNTTELPNGGVMDKDGNIKSDDPADTPDTDSSFKIGDTTVTLPEGGEAKENNDGTVTVPDGSVVTPPSGRPEIEITDGKNKAIVDKNGNVTFPEGGKANIGGAEITVPSGGTIEPQEDGKIHLPGGATVTKNGTTLTVPAGGAVYDPATGKLADSGSSDNSDSDSDDNSNNGSGNNPGGDSNNPYTGEHMVGIAAIILAGAVCAAAVTVKRKKTK